MIFVTVGANTPFDRLVRCVDDWAASRGDEEVFAQIGTTDYRPAHLRWIERLSPAEFQERIQRASFVVAHAGMGTILSSLEAGVPILVMPRRAALREMRNDHQLATARRLGERGVVHVAIDEAELHGQLERLDELSASRRIPSVAPPRLIARICGFIEEG